MNEFTKKDILENLELIAEKLKSSNKTADIGIYGGSAIILLWEFRKSTRDIDIMIRNGEEEIKNIARDIAAYKKYPEDWLSDQVRTFTSINYKERLFLEIPKDEPSLRIFVPTTKYLLAMKCIAMRHETDTKDVKSLIKLLKITKEEDVLSIIDKYYPYDVIPDRTSFGIKEIMKEINLESFPDKDVINKQNNTPESEEDAFTKDLNNRNNLLNKGKGWKR
ncbi:MAG: hypothetical protein EVG15_03130 [Candidatus Acididesulfobacter diazotrophicus]|jgi:hypothetical protein|uniref:DUF6036 domain-containing protein n=1 Tax=Candidatus Acididesulfobacter diazotrophicus TaxID=2597226 RepID=A0A519BPB4_9DELT|nr:MAG: hypothetical protein EVG15_03130 [Candidatus Acididesulfobacter diazotrophicus]